MCPHVTSGIDSRKSPQWLYVTRAYIGYSILTCYRSVETLGKPSRLELNNYDGKTRGATCLGGSVDGGRPPP